MEVTVSLEPVKPKLTVADLKPGTLFSFKGDKGMGYKYLYLKLDGNVWGKSNAKFTSQVVDFRTIFCAVACNSFELLHDSEGLREVEIMDTLTFRVI